MKDFKENVKKDPVPNLHAKKRSGPNLTNSRNYTYSTCCDYYCAINISRNINSDANRR